MCQLTDIQIEKILEVLKRSEITAYKISKDTGITQSTLSNYRRGKTFPTQANASILQHYFNINFADCSGDFSQNSNSVVLGNNTKAGNIDNRQYYLESPDVLRAQVDLLNERIKEKDALLERLLQIIDNLSSGQVSDAK